MTENENEMERDIQRLMTAVTELAEAVVQPVVRTFDVIGDSLGERQQGPRVRLSSLDAAGNSLVSSSIRLAERLSTLALDVVSPRARNGASSGVPTGRVGEQLRMPMMVENPGREAMKELAFRVVALAGPEGSSLSGASLSVVPAAISVAPGDFEKLTLVVDVPVGAVAGEYEGRLGLEGDSSLQVPFRFCVE